jgi:hypothetical protein
MTDKDPKADAPESAAPAPASSKADDAKGKGAGKSNAVWMGTAVGVGSAALVAALMYAKRRK